MAREECVAVKMSGTSSGLVSINNHLWATWMKTAIEQAQRAHQARGRLASYPWSPEHSPSSDWIAMLEQEFQAHWSPSQRRRSRSMLSAWALRARPKVEELEQMHAKG